MWPGVEMSRLPTHSPSSIGFAALSPSQPDSENWPAEVPLAVALHQNELLHLAGRRTRQRVMLEYDVSGDFEAGQR